ncbi:hypothetical protein GQ457_10G013850 [Hibiscus cannabinus]
MVKDGEGMTSPFPLCEWKRMLLVVPPPLMKNRKYLSKQLSMSREIAWERRRHQFLGQQRGGNGWSETVQYAACFGPQSRPSSSDSSLGGGSSSFHSPVPVSEAADWKIYSPGENPKQVKAKLRHWAQAVACSLMQSY